MTFCPQRVFQNKDGHLVGVPFLSTYKGLLYLCCILFSSLSSPPFLFARLNANVLLQVLLFVYMPVSKWPFPREWLGHTHLMKSVWYGNTVNNFA